MPFTVFSTGHDVTVNFTSPLDGTLIPLGLVTDFDRKPIFKKLKSNPLSSPPVTANVPDGWEGTFTVDRNSPALDSLFAALELGYWNGLIIGTGMIMEYIAESSGVTSQFQYTGVSLNMTDAGNIQTQNKIIQKVAWEASIRLQLQ